MCSTLISATVQVYIPKMYPEFSSERVLTMEWINGVKPRTGSASTATLPGSGRQSEKPDKAKGGNASHRSSGSAADLALVEVGVRCSLEQMLQEGFYHADPHAGNLLRMDDGRLCYLDFGMMGRIDERTRQGLVRATLHMVNQEFDQLAEDFVTLGLLPDDSKQSKEQIVRALTGALLLTPARQGNCDWVTCSDRCSQPNLLSPAHPSFHPKNAYCFQASMAFDRCLVLLPQSIAYREQFIEACTLPIPRGLLTHFFH
jgi:tRNA A-37 threonylcarbamoyl transferase component Bud32